MTRFAFVVLMDYSSHMTTLPSWEHKSKCLDQPILFEHVAFGAGDRVRKPEDLRAVAQAKQMCITCPVRQQCLDAAMEEEAYLGGAERHGIRGGLTAKERILIAAQDPMCARCTVNPVMPSNTITKLRRLCTKCQSSTQNDLTARYCPPKARSLEKILKLI